ncbi:DUF202 domain-containing protein [Pseudonocardia nematodicida]|uniref:DUF202 domain-containing protein n=1 Tax=Pseudonocardia nematodicida TaxID=1206997 RepID=A0ABV1KJM2_9PSEU
MSALFDAGLQPERTGLAWRRTAIALAVGSLIALRVLPDAGGSAWLLLPGMVGLITAAGLLVAAERRYRQTHRRLTAELPGHVGGGAIVAATALATGLLALAALLFVLTR